jgi:hypothetical protein
LSLEQDATLVLAMVVLEVEADEFCVIRPDKHEKQKQIQKQKSMLMFVK